MTAVALQVDDLHKRFDAVTAAEGISVSIPEGVVWSLIGSNGAGKTTFVNMVTGYIKPDRGRILFHGRDITALTPREITRLGMRRSFQIPQLCAELTVLENMLVSCAINQDRKPSFWRPATAKEDIEKAMEILTRFRIADSSNHRMAELSGGVRKLLDIAMALYGNLKVILLDEPTSGVAMEEKFPIMDLVMEALSKENVTTLFVEHDMDIVTRYSERVLAFYDGRIIANDSPDEVMRDERVQRYITGTVK